MKIIFLDIDGVLNSEAFYMSDRYNSSEVNTAIENYARDIDPISIELINDLIDTTDAQVVVSSSWRSIGVNNLQAIFECVGFRHKILDITPSGCKDCVRGNEILSWIIDNESVIGNNNDYVILDDNQDMLYSQKDSFIRTDSRFGLTSDLQRKAKELLSSTGLNELEAQKPSLNK